MRGVTARDSDTGCNSILNQKYSTLFILVLKKLSVSQKIHNLYSCTLCQRAGRFPDAAGSVTALPPACAPGECLLRCSLMATHTKELIDEATDIIVDVISHYEE